MGVKICLKYLKNKEVFNLKKFFSLLTCICFFALSFGCGSVSGDNLNIVTSFYPIYIMVLNLTEGVEGVSVTNMAENHTGCLHDFQLQTSDMKKIEKCNAFVINGAGMESFLDKIVATNPNIRIVDSSEGIDILEDKHTHHHNEEAEQKDDEDSEEDEGIHGNPHIWVSISNYIEQIRNICKGLASADPKNEEKYKSNADIYIKKLESLKEKMHSELDTLPNRDILTFHEAFPYFAKEFNLNVAAVINREPESEPSVKELSETINTIKELGVKSLFVEPQYPSASAEVIAKETGANIYTLDPSSSGEIFKDAYINAMEKNLEVLKEALA